MSDIPIRKINESGEISIPRFAKRHMQVDNGDLLELEEGPNKTIILKKWVKGAALIALVACMGLVFSNHYAYAQQRVVEQPSDNSVPRANITGTGGQRVVNQGVSDPIEPIHLTGPGAYYPLELFVTYPEGRNSTTPTITHNIPNSNFDSLLHSKDGIVTWTFTSNSTDNYNIAFTQNYDASPNQVIVIRAIANHQQTYDTSIPITGKTAKINFRIDTSEAPHYPTAEEVAAVTTKHIDAFGEPINRIDSKTDTLVSYMSLFVGWISGTFGLLAIAAVGSFAGFIAMWALKRQISTVLTNRRKIGAEQK